MKDQTIDQVFSGEQEKLIALPISPFDGYQGTTARVSSQLLVNFDRNRYSVNAMAVGKSVEVRAYADRIVMVMNGTRLVSIAVILAGTR